MQSNRAISPADRSNDDGMAELSESLQALVDAEVRWSRLAYKMRTIPRHPPPTLSSRRLTLCRPLSIVPSAALDPPLVYLALAFARDPEHDAAVALAVLYKQALSPLVAQ
jgi:hypothetical protein